MSADANQFGCIGVLMGGYSSERSISLKSGKAVAEALGATGCQVKAIDVVSQYQDEIASTIRAENIDVAFIALHGQLGEDGVIQSILEKLDIPYTGSGVEASQLALNKAMAQKIFKEKGIKIPDFKVLSKDSVFDADEVAGALPMPLIVKPAQEGSSIGAGIVEKKENLQKAVEEAFAYDNHVLVERYIRGKELTVGILGDQALPIVEIKPQRPFFDFDAKYEDGMTEYVVPMPLPDDITARIQQTALTAHRALGCRDLSRVDFMLDHKMTDYLLEINTIPGFTGTSLVPKAAKAAGIEFEQLCFKLIEMAYEKKK